ncbi:MAG: alpha/beta fold hydrolase [Deltaproteobacteria bacterium]|nr:alpha/beta fold hydrolase [Deltaproteobacteria bacterium]MBN2671895.1 alpha/beta fold hydrolase [Deltaproteobacteria bacterium]
MKSDVQFYSEGAVIKGHLYRPDPPTTDTPIVVLAHGFAGVKEMLLPAYAEYFSQHGFAALTFDYRGFGDSEGVPGRLVPAEQIADIRNAITFATTLENIDAARIALWGTSYGGANAIVAAAQDRRVKTLAVQLTFGDGERVIMGDKNDEEKAKIRDSIERIWAKSVTTNKMMMLGVNRLLGDEQSKAFYQRFVEQFDALKIKLPFLTMKETIDHKPERLIGWVNAPVMITAATNDLVNPKEESYHLFEKANEPKALVEIAGATHYEVYEGEFFEQAASKQLEWFQTHLV